jgi:hypothetical protein
VLYEPRMFGRASAGAAGCSVDLLAAPTEGQRGRSRRHGLAASPRRRRRRRRRHVGCFSKHLAARSGQRPGLSSAPHPSGDRAAAAAVQPAAAARLLLSSRLLLSCGCPAAAAVLLLSGCCCRAIVVGTGPADRAVAPPGVVAASAAFAALSAPLSPSACHCCSLVSPCALRSALCLHSLFCDLRSALCLACPGTAATPRPGRRGARRMVNAAGFRCAVRGQIRRRRARRLGFGRIVASERDAPNPFVNRL